MPPITKRRTGRGFEREIQALQRLRTAIVLDDRIAVNLHGQCLTQIDALVGTLAQLMKIGINQESTPPPAADVDGIPVVQRRRRLKFVE